MNVRYKWMPGVNEHQVPYRCCLPVEGKTSFHMYLYQYIAYGTWGRLWFLEIEWVGEGGHTRWHMHPSSAQQQGCRVHFCLLLQVLVLSKWQESRCICAVYMVVFDHTHILYLSPLPWYTSHCRCGQKPIFCGLYKLGGQGYLRKYGMYGCIYGTHPTTHVFKKSLTTNNIMFTVCITTGLTADNMYLQ